MLKFTKNFPDGGRPDYPLTQEQITKWEQSSEDFSGIVSLRVGKSHGAILPAAICNSAGLIKSTDEVVAVRAKVEASSFPTQFLTDYWPGDFGDMPTHFPAALANAHNIFALEGPLSFDNPKGCAQVVRMDDEGDLYRVLKPWMRGQGFVPAGAERRSLDFVDIGSADAVEARLAIDVALEKAFEQKWYFGCPRPEEVYGSNMTAYEEGCPGHCSFGAGHAAFSFATAKHFSTKWFKRHPRTRELQRLPQAVLKELFWIAYLWSMFRTFAGVHFAVDNLLPAYRAHEVGFVNQ